MRRYEENQKMHKQNTVDVRLMPVCQCNCQWYSTIKEVKPLNLDSVV